MGILDWKHWIVILVVVVLVFGTKKLKNLGTDVGESIKGFRNAMNDEDADSERPPASVQQAGTAFDAPPVIDGQHRQV
ncbi:twin-arginine translocase TatA/TatE family subunit [Pseudomonas sp. B21-040]|uniref:twin-arginine translocase TatA/TatE family subunit n=1 Tax=Pseudomonas sp. B21-040 TaxID=2895486 RepID=UPI00215F5F23|nr:twin-arginine translocase TatA/TatE family subunit [Pseudomonas sp. B21-040]UVL42210.1 twin-arginine translocase TatA/TatE family subunit [Pseudomonas sp. B21-040]